MPVIFAQTIGHGTNLCVWHATEDAGFLRGMVDLGPEDERLFASVSNKSRKLQWLGCRMALSYLMQTPRLRIRYDSFGKPYLVSDQADISFTHTGKFAAAICSSTCKVGIDLEQVREKISRVASRFLTPGELSMASGKEDRLKVLTLFWSAKETLYKINGKPDLDIQHDLCIESFTYLCLPDGELNTRIKRPASELVIPVSYHLMEDTILTWAAVPRNT